MLRALQWVTEHRFNSYHWSRSVCLLWSPPLHTHPLTGELVNVWGGTLLLMFDSWKCIYQDGFAFASVLVHECERECGVCACVCSSSMVASPAHVFSIGNSSETTVGCQSAVTGDTRDARENDQMGGEVKGRWGREGGIARCLKKNWMYSLLNVVNVAHVGAGLPPPWRTVVRQTVAWRCDLSQSMATLLSCLLSFVQSPPKCMHNEGWRLTDPLATVVVNASWRSGQYKMYHINV